MGPKSTVRQRQLRACIAVIGAPSGNGHSGLPAQRLPFVPCGLLHLTPSQPDKQGPGPMSRVADPDCDLRGSWASRPSIAIGAAHAGQAGIGAEHRDGESNLIHISVRQVLRINCAFYIEW